MKRLLILIFLFGVLFSCKSDDDGTEGTTDLIANWKLVEQLLDPGDGSGTFQPVDSNLTVEFFNNGTVVSRNGSLCNVFTESENTSSGTFSLEENRISIECTNNTIFISFEKEGSDLILYFTCIEGCAQKYKRIP